MNKTDWEQAKKKLKKAFETGMDYLKEGAREASFVKDKAVTAMGLEIDLFKLKNRLNHEYQKIGKELAHQVAKSSPLKLTQTLKMAAQEITGLEEKAKKIEKQLKNFTVTRKT